MSDEETEISEPKILVGTSGFSYKDWKGYFYPQKIKDAQMLPFYANYFPVVEINSTYYGIPDPRNMEAMVNKTEGKMEFVVKANQDITHNREKVEDALPAFKEALKPLQDHNVLGGVLLQFPYSFMHNQPNRDYIAMLK